jgi:aspartate racemase
MRKTIGVLGGMGPEATVYLFDLIVQHTQAAKDQDHIPIIIYNNPKIPERTAAVLGKGPSPAPLLVEGVRKLAAAGADFIVVPCITAHAYMRVMKAASPVQILSLLDETLSFARKSIPGLARAGLLASTGTVKSGLFEKTFSRAGIEVITPAEEDQDRVMEAVFGPGGIKAGCRSGRPRRLLLGVGRRLIRRGARALIAGCTEVPLVLKEEDFSVPLLEPLRIAAAACVLRAGYRLKKPVRS